MIACGGMAYAHGYDSTATDSDPWGDTDSTATQVWLVYAGEPAPIQEPVPDLPEWPTPEAPVLPEPPEARARSIVCYPANPRAPPMRLTIELWGASKASVPTNEWLGAGEFKCLI